MKTIEEIIQYFYCNATLYSKITEFSDKPGIYAVHFMGNAFPVYALKPRDKEIIYIGKTEKSQASRDANTHFATGKTGSSTLRRSIGALMQKGAKLKSIPRSTSEKNEKRFTNYMFDEQGEKLITDWMTKNLGLSFYEFSDSVDELDGLETKLIRALKPMLNIDRKNTENPHFETIRNFRAECVKLAKENESYVPVKQKESEVKRINTFSGSNNSELYTDIWETMLTLFNEKLENAESFSVQFKQHVFNTVGNRQNYSFKLDMVNGIVQNNINGSAVARDLYKVLSGSKVVKHLLQNKEVIFRLNKDFVFSMDIF